MLREALRYPTRGDDAVETLLVGGGLHLLAAAFPPAAPVGAVFVLGFLVHVLARAADGPRGLAERPPPTFRAVRRVGRAGVGGLLVSAAYLLLPTVLLAVTATGALSRRVGDAGLGLGPTVGVLAGSLTTLFLALAFVYLLPAALANYAAAGRLRAAFDRASLLRAATDARYFVAFCSAGTLLGLAAVAAGGLDRVLVGFFLAFYLEVAAAALVVEGMYGVVGVVGVDGTETGRTESRVEPGGDVGTGFDADTEAESTVESDTG
ncbi:DUF4013 domain-containing protein [Halobium salinum]|uniref:DUF4013 domain-containing protein n=1 Tax=Halobium salinum TaxID=1364940 RepID=A0ABD5PEA7_9EURY|nr:DUF4013 domain-containing protein [Halobium salinum]